MYYTVQCEKREKMQNFYGVHMVFYGYPMVGSAKRAINGAERSRLRNRQAFAPCNKNNKKKHKRLHFFFRKICKYHFFFVPLCPLLIVRYL